MIKWFNKIWRKMFPVEKVFYPIYEGFEGSLDVNKSIKGMYPFLVNAQKESPDFFQFIAYLTLEKEDALHELPSPRSADEQMVYALDSRELLAQINILKRILRIPAESARYLNNQNKKDEEKQKAKKEESNLEVKDGRNG